MNSPREPFVDEGVPPSNDAPVPLWLITSYIFLPFFGLLLMVVFWNGSFGWFDRGAWQQLQRAANTTFPTQNVNAPRQ